MEKVRQLPSSFNQKGATYTQIEKTDDYYLYKVEETVEDKVAETKQEITYYEIFKAKVIPVDECFAKMGSLNGYTHYVPYPSNESFGSWAWCCSNMERVQNIKEIKFAKNAVGILA